MIESTWSSDQAMTAAISRTLKPALKSFVAAVPRRSWKCLSIPAFWTAFCQDEPNPVLHGSFNGNYSRDFAREHVWALGGTNTPGTLDGRCQDVWFFDHKSGGAHAATANPEDQGVFVCEDLCQAFKWRNLQVFDHKGYGIYLKGTLANRNVNSLCRGSEVDVECSHAFSGTVQVDSFRGSTFEGTWSSGQGAATSGGGTNMAACRTTTNSQNCSFRFPHMTLSGWESYAGWDEGTNNTFDLNVSGDASQSEAGFLLGASALRGRYVGTIDQMRYVAKNLSASTAGHYIDLQFDTVGVQLQSGLSAVNNYTVDFNYQGTTDRFLTAATTTTVPGTLKEYQLNLGVSPVDNLSVTYSWYGRETRYVLVDAITIRDASTSGGNLSLGTIGGTFVSAGRGVITFKTEASFYREIDRNG